MKELDLAESVGSMSTEELTARRDKIASRLGNGARYSKGEIKHIQEALSPGNPYTPEFARNILFVTDVYDQQVITQELEKRSSAG